MKIVPIALQPPGNIGRNRLNVVIRHAVRGRKDLSALINCLAYSKKEEEGISN